MLHETDENAAEPSTSSEELAKQVDAIKKHPLFPVMELVLKKCEKAMLTLDEDNFKMDDVTDLIKHLQKKNGNSSINTDNSEVNELMKNAIFTLRIHLLELAKLNELCNKFHTKYTSSMKKVLHVNDDSLYSSNDDSDGESPCSFSRLENGSKKPDASEQVIQSNWLNFDSATFLPLFLNSIGGNGADLLPANCGAQLVEKINQKVNAQNQKKTRLSEDKETVAATTPHTSKIPTRKRNSNTKNSLEEPKKKRKMQYNAESLI